MNRMTMKQLLGFKQLDVRLCDKCRYYKHLYDHCAKFRIRPGARGGCCYYKRSGSYIYIISDEYHSCTYQ